MAASSIGPRELPFLASGGELGELIASKDWSGTTLGPPAQWPATLRVAVGIMLSSRFPMFLAWGPQLAFLYNDAYVPVLGKKHPDAVGQPFERVWHDIWPVIQPLITAALANEATYQEDLLLVMQRSGFVEETYFTFSYSPIPSAEGPPAGLFCACTDTTERVVGERRLRTLRELGEISAAQAPTVQHALSAALEVLAGNRADVPYAMTYLLDDACAARLGGSYGLAAGSSAIFATLPHPDADQSIWRVATGGTAELTTGLSRRYAGAFLGGASLIGDDAPDAAMVLPVVPAGGERPVAVLVAALSPYRKLDTDYRTFYELLAGQVAIAVTDALAYQAERARAAALAELDRVKTEFFSNISHEFRTPLTLITGPVAELRAAPTLQDGPQLREELAVIHRNGLRLGKLVTTLLDFSRLQAGRAQAAFEPVDLPAFTTELASVFRAAIERAGLVLRVDCAPLPEPAYLDRQMWERIVLNLLSNALKFTFTGTITVSMRRAEPPAEGETRRAVLEVSDTGIGIPAGEVDRLFERFHQVAGAQGRSAEGSGIGLALVRELVTLHGGTVTVRSTVGAGSTFAVAIPLGHEHLPAEQVQPSSTGATSSATGELYMEEALRWLPPAADAGTDLASSTTAGAPADAPRVLIADDNADMREYLARLLSTRYQVHAVPNGAVALAAARAQIPDLVLTDVMMPGLDGFGLLAQLRADQRTAGIPVIMLSARAGEEAAVEGLAAGADDYLVKPFTATELLARVDSHLALSRLRHHEQERMAAQLHASQEALRLLSDYADDVIARHAPDGTWRYVSPSIQRLSGHRPEELVGRSPLELIHPDDHDTVHALLTSLTEGPAEATMRLRRTDGSYLWMETRKRLVHDAHGDGWEIHSVTRDVTVRVHAEQTRREMTAERAARAASDAAAARMRSMVDGLNAIVWEADAASGHTSFVSERVEEVLGYPPDRWVGQRSDAWRSIIHPEDRNEVVRTRVQATAAGRDHDLTYRAIAADGRVVWLHDLVHVAADADGTPRRQQGVMIDITEQKRAEQAATLLAEVASIHTEPAPLTQRLTALAQAAVTVLADLAVVSVLRLDGMLHPVTAAYPGRPDIEQTVLGYPPYLLPAQLLSRCLAGRPFTQPTPYSELGVRTTLLIPLVIHRRLLATLTFSSIRAREYDDADVALAAELGQRAALMIETERVATRERQLHEITTALTAAATVEQAARVLVAGVIEVLDANAAGVWIIQSGALQLVHQVGYPTEVMDRYRVTGLDNAIPTTDCARTGAPVWLRDDDEWQDNYPHLVSDHAQTGNRAFAGLPLRIGSRVVGTLTASFVTRRDFDADERSFTETLAGQAALAFERAALADTRAQVAEELQRSLLPAALPELDRLALAARYLPGAPNVQAGGDWYDVLPLDQQRVALAAGDVVGQGPTAAAVMGQLRSALAGFLLEGHGPGVALHHLDRFAARVPGALACTAVVVVLDLGSGELRWCRAGHPPPLLLEHHHARYLIDSGSRLPLGLDALDPDPSPPVPDGVTHLEPGACLLLYTDGLVERRGQAIDEGLDHLAATAEPLGHAPPDTLLDQLLAATPSDTGPADDIALVAARYLPAPLHQRLPAEPGCLRGLRRMVSAWATIAGLSADHVEGLQLALGEAAANAAEHAYAGRAPGELEVDLTHRGDGAIEARVRDHGAWRPEPAGNEYRGRGLDMIHALARDVVLIPSSTGTTISFTLPAPAASPLDTTDRPSVAGDRSLDPEPASLVLHPAPGRTRRLELCGELDLTGTATLRRPLLDYLAAPGPVILDLRGLRYLASAGVGLLIEAAHHATTHDTPLQLLLTPHSMPARILALTGLDQHLPITQEPPEGA